MPVYQFLNKNSNEVEEHTMSYKVLDQFKEDNPHLERYFSIEGLAGLGDGIRMSTPGTGQPVKAFEQGVIQRIKDSVPGNTLAKTHKTKMPREW
jgi:murein DD-endopeptidase MepM/ murein hydrolase activator NlpD